MHKKSFIPLILFGLVVLIVVTPVSARVVESGGTITAGETGLELAFVDDCPSAKFGW